jgi:hypothetical protein
MFLLGSIDFAYLGTHGTCFLNKDRAITQAVVSGFPPRRPGFDPRSSHVDLWWTKWLWRRFSPSTSVSLASSHPTYCSTLIIITRGLYSRPSSGRRIKWAKSDPTSRKKLLPEHHHNAIKYSANVVIQILTDPPFMKILSFEPTLYSPESWNCVYK